MDRPATPKITGANVAGTIIWYGVQGTGKDPTRAHAYLMTEKGLSERPLCGRPYTQDEPEPILGRCRRCEDISVILTHPSAKYRREHAPSD